MNTHKILPLILVTIGLVGNSLQAGRVRVGYPFEGKTVQQENIPVGALVVTPFKNKSVVGVVTGKGLHDDTYAIHFGSLTHDPTIENMVLDHCTPIFPQSLTDVSTENILVIPHLVIGAESKPFAGSPSDAFNNGDVVTLNGKVALADIISGFDEYNVVTDVATLSFEILEQNEMNNTDMLLLSAN